MDHVKSFYFIEKPFKSYFYFVNYEIPPNRSIYIFIFYGSRERTCRQNGAISYLFLDLARRPTHDECKTHRYLTFINLEYFRIFLTTFLLIMNKLNPEQLLVSPSVCRSCRLGKKRCDRRLPFCTRCARSAIYIPSLCFSGLIRHGHRRGAECDYNTKTNLTKGQELLLLRNKFENLERAFQTAATHQAHGSPGSGVLVHYAPDINNSHISPDTHQDYPKSPSNQQLVSGVSYSIDTGNIHLLVYKQACSIFESRHTNFMAACDVYFNTVHNWQPILSKNHIYSKIRRISTDIPEGDLSILLLAICLIIQLPARPKICGSVEDSIPIYSIVKALHVQLQTLLPPSIYLLQAQLIITAFEHGHGLLTASYLSIGTCARLSEILAINRQGDDISHQWKIPSNKEPNPTNEERRLWWGCIIRDRYISLKLLDGCSLYTDNHPGKSMLRISSSFGS